MDHYISSNIHMKKNKNKLEIQVRLAGVYYWHDLDYK